MAKLYVVSLTDAQRLLLRQTIKKGKSSARTTTRTRILWKADASPEGPEWTGIAIKALSAAINDPTTAVQAMDHLEDTLLVIGKTDLDRRRQRRDREGRVRLVLPAATWSDFLTQGVTEIREYGATSVQVMRRLRAMLDVLRRDVLPPYRAAVDEELARLQSSVQAGFGGQIDLDRALLSDREGIGGPSTTTSNGLGTPAHAE